VNIAVANEAMCEQCPCQQAIRRKHLHVCIQCVKRSLSLGHDVDAIRTFVSFATCTAFLQHYVPFGTSSHRGQRNKYCRVRLHFTHNVSFVLSYVYLSYYLSYSVAREWKLLCYRITQFRYGESIKGTECFSFMLLAKENAQSSKHCHKSSSTLALQP
jgi:hypothetical protein